MHLPLQPYWSLFKTYLAPQRGRIIRLAIVLLSMIGMQLANPQVLRFFIDAAVSGAATQSLFFAAALFLVLALLIQALTVLVTYLSEEVRVFERFRSDALRLNAFPLPRFLATS